MSNEMIYINVGPSWTLISPGDMLYYVKNQSGYTVAICRTPDNTVPPDNLDELSTYSVIGGVVKEIKAYIGECTWAKCLTNNIANLKIKPEGVIDPDEDITEIAAAVNNLYSLINMHFQNKNNPHTVTLTQLKIGWMPLGGLSNDPTYTDNDKIPSTKSVNIVLSRILNHENNLDNPHTVTKKQIGLENVANFLPASIEEELDSNNRTSYMTPAGVANAIGYFTESGTSLKPQMIIKSKMNSRLTGWSVDDCYLPTKQMETVNLNNTQVKINSGLQVTFANKSKTLLSEVLDRDIIVTLNTTNEMYYIYIDLDSKGKIITAGYHKEKPLMGFYRENNESTFFDLSRNIMLNAANEEIFRVYIGAAKVSSGLISELINIPLGYHTVIPVTNALMTSERYIVTNPFLSEVDVYAEVYFSGKWSRTYWNDQIGVLATPNPTDPTGQIVIQCGQMGFLSCGKESGSAHGKDFTSISSSLKTRLVITKRLGV